MNTKLRALIVLFAGLQIISNPGHAEDIDIYSGLGTDSNTPNVLFIIDNSANFEASSGGVTCMRQADGSLVINSSSGTATSMSGKVGGIEQCALWNVVKNLPVNADGTARVNLGFMFYNGPNIRDINGLNCGGSLGGCLTQPMIAMTTSNKTGILNWISAWDTTPSSTVNVKAAGKATAAVLQEAWAYYGGNTGLSTRSYAGINPTGGCQKNFIIYIGNAFSASSNPGDSSSGDPLSNTTNGLTAIIDGQAKPSSLTSAQWTEKKTQWKTPILNTINTACGAAPGTYNFATPSSNHTENAGDFADEWTRFLKQSDIYPSSPDGMQGITTYTVGLLDPTACDPHYPALLTNMAVYGGGKYFASTSYDTLVNSIMKILNEVQAVNSVFSSSSLPVSVNAQGTYLNQIYMGMFRPDSGALPRWAGNLKQYQFQLDPTTNTLQLADSVGNQALDSSGTGFLSPNAISFWSCTDMANSPNSYLSSGALTANQLSLLSRNNQSCTDPLPNGFWSNDQSSANAVSKGFDLPDGELVERGGSAQQIRHTTLTADYTTAAGSTTNPRKLYTWCPSGTGCVASLTDASNLFATSNASLLNPNLFASASVPGSLSTTVNISSLTRSGGIVTVTTTGNHGFLTGNTIAIANAVPGDYNGSFPITVTGSNTFTYNLAEYPPTPSIGSYSLTRPGTPVSITSIVRSGNTVTVTTSANHGLSINDQTVITGASPNDYNGSHIVTSAPSTTQFRFTLNESPTTVAGSGTASSVTKTTGLGCPCSTTVTINAWNAATPGVQRTLGSTTVTVHTNTNITANPNNYTVGRVVSISGVTDSQGVLIPAYNGNFTIVSVGSPTTNSFTYSIPAASITPAASATITASTFATTPAMVITISGITRTGNMATATAIAHGVATDGTGTFSISGTPGAHETAYIGNFTASVTSTANTLVFPVTLSPATPATGLGGASMTATLSGLLSLAQLNELLDWVRGKDSQGDEFGPGGSVTIRPSVHGDVLHSRPTVVNYGTYAINITNTSDSGTTRTATASSSDVTTIGMFGATPIVTFTNGQACPVTVASATTFTYQNTSCGAPGAQAASVGSKVIVFYGDNGGVFHAVNGNQTSLFGSTGPGDELWGFIPTEHLPKLNRLRNNSPQLNLPSTPPGIAPQPRAKDYFVDGGTGVYQTMDASGNTTRAIIYLTMRRGGNAIYAIDVTTPTAPVMLWKVDSTGITTPSGFTASTLYSEIGETWSQPKVAKVKGVTDPVLIFGGGYDTNEDNEPPTADTTGRGIYVLNALTGALVWKATHSASGSTTCSGSSTQASCVVNGMNYAVAADITLVDRDRDGSIDRLYAADTGGNVWRIDLQPGGNATPNFWRVYALAQLGCFTGPCSIPTSTTQRKIFYPPEVITATTNHNYDAVIAGTGDREHPLYVNTSTQRYNRVVLLKDTYTGDSASGMTAITLDGSKPLFDATTTPWDGTLNGYYVTLGAGEKVVNAPLVTAGYVYFGTNQPSPPSTTSCTSNLGTATGYTMNPFTGTTRKVVFSGGGLPPSPVSGVVNIVVGGVVKQVAFIIGAGSPDCAGSDCASALGGQKPQINVSTKRTRNYWYIENK